MRVVRLLLPVVAVLTLARCACGTEEGPDAGTDDPDAGDPQGDAGPDPPDFVTGLNSLADMQELENEDGRVDFFLQVSGAPETAPIRDDCVFVNSGRFASHLDFINATSPGVDLAFEEYQDLAIHRPGRVWWVGTMLLDPEVSHPIVGSPPTLVWALFTDDDFEIGDVIAAHTVLEGCAEPVADVLAITPSSARQTDVLTEGQATLADSGIAVLLE